MLVIKNRNKIERIVRACNSYFSENSFVDFMLSEAYTSESLNEGFFEILRKGEETFVVHDIHLQIEFGDVVLEPLKPELIRKGDILHAQLVEEGSRWRLVSLEMIYPDFAKVYLV